MTAPKAVFNFQNYKGVLPYASELFGVYQPLLGWKSKRHQRRFARGYAVDPLQIIDKLTEGILVNANIGLKHEAGATPALAINEFNPKGFQPDVTVSRSLLVTSLRKALQRGRSGPVVSATDAQLSKLLSKETVNKLLQSDVADAVNQHLRDAAAHSDVARLTAAPAPSVVAARAQLEYEVKLGATLMQLSEDKQFDALRNLLLPVDWKERHAALIQAALAKGPLDHYVPDFTRGAHPQFDLDRIVLSPIGIVHLFRQYFFELDSFLGSPVGHVWLSPGTSLELIEISTRKVMVEKTFEQSVETTKKSELTATDKDELSDAVKQDNQTDIKFGASVTASYAGVTASSNFDLNNTQKQARETSHKHMREQSSKLSTEIKTNYKTTFKTVTETTDTTSKRYVIQNPSPDRLQNYELRRKMRQVAVQVQDVGTYLCWQTYVDNPGDTLDLSTLVHIAEPADLDSIPHPDKPAQLDPKSKNYVIDFPYQNISDGDDTDVIFYKGDDRESWPDHNDKIVWERDFVLDSPGLGYTLDPNSVQITSHHSDICVPRVALVAGTTKARVSLDQVNFHDLPAVKLEITAVWNPPAQDLTEYNKKMVEYNNARARAQQEAYNKAVKERITLASKIAPRPADDLREEERIVVYRTLIQDMLLPKGYGNKDPIPETPDTLAARHVLSELIESIFDVDKMLYFVAPEWWKPRFKRGTQFFGGNPSGPHAAPVAVADRVGWDAINDVHRKRYYLTEDSQPAKLGSSLGWILQLDGDNLRNAFLNAPWVKAVVPIRPGKEKDAIAWLKHVEGFNGIGPGDLYTGEGMDDEGNPLKGKPLVDVLDFLADSVTKKHQEELTARAFDLSDPALPHDPDSTITATPVDRVWEHGFNPLQGGFQARPLSAEDDPFGSSHFQTFDQWVEILPTDQVVPVVVEYDPKTGRLKDPAL